MKKDKIEKSNQFTKIRIYIYIAYISLFLLMFFHKTKEVVAEGNAIVVFYFYICIFIVSLMTITYPILVTSLVGNKHQEFWYKKVSDSIDLFSLFVLLCAFCQGFFAYGYFRASVVGKSMNPTYYQDDALVVRSSNKDIKHFDVVVAVIDEENRNYRSVPEDELIIKRVIGMAGDTLEYHDNHLYINGVSYSEEYTATQEDRFNNINLKVFLGHGVEEIDGKYVISSGYYYLMGDNRGNSSDSRYFGLFKENQIIGVVKYELKSLFNWIKVENPFSDD